MKISKIFLAVFTVMLILAGTSIASAGDGTIGDPYTVIYIGYNMPGMYMDMCGLAGGSGLYDVVSNVSGNLGNDVYYDVTYNTIDYNSMYLPIPGSIDNCTALVTASSTADYLIVDMAFSDYNYDNGTGPIDTARASFFTVCNNSNIGKTASIYSDDGSKSLAPPNFDFRDKAAYSGIITTFITRMTNGLNANNGAPTFEDLLSYLN